MYYHRQDNESEETPQTNPTLPQRVCRNTGKGLLGSSLMPILKRLCLTSLAGALLFMAVLFTGSGCFEGNASASNASYNYPTKDVAGLAVYAEKEYSGIVMVVGNTANQPLPTIAEGIKPFFTTLFFSENFEDAGTIKIVSAAEGHRIIESSGLEMERTNRDGNEGNNRGRAERNFAALETILASEPQADHLDVLSGMKEGVVQLAHLEGPKLMVVMSSGLNDTGNLNFASNPGLINTDPLTVADTLLHAEGAHVSETTLAGYDLVFCGLGNTTLPQPELENEGASSRENLRALYEHLVSALGGNLLYMDESPAASEQSVETNYVVNPTIFDASAPLIWADSPESTAWHFGEESLTFVADFATFTNREAAKQALTVVAETLAAHPEATVSIVGYQAATETNSYVSSSELTTARASAVHDVLVSELGVDPAQIAEVRGAGTGTFAPSEYNEAGVWDTNIAALNRVVTVTVSY